MKKQYCATLIIPNNSFFFLWPELEELCFRIGIEPTRRQASKFRNRKGLLWKVFDRMDSEPDRIGKEYRLHRIAHNRRSRPGA